LCDSFWSRIRRQAFLQFSHTQNLITSVARAVPRTPNLLIYCRAYALCEINSSGKEFTQTQRIDDHITFVFSEVPDRNT
jgi:hypothetical protein